MRTFPVLTLSWEDVKYLFPDLPEISNDDMARIADVVADGISESGSFWAILEYAVGSVLELTQEEE